MEIVIRATVTFWMLWVLLRATGKRELAELTAFELITLMVLGDIIQQGVTGEDMSVTGSFLAVGTIILWTMALSYATFKSRRLATALGSAPAIVVEDGRLVNEMLELQRLSPEDVRDAAREQGIARLDDIRYGILEADGRFSFLTRGEGRRQPQIEGPEV